MKTLRYILGGVAAITLVVPLSSLAQTNTGSTTCPIPVVQGGGQYVDWNSFLMVVNCLQSRIDALSARVVALESRTGPLPAPQPTINVNPTIQSPATPVMGPTSISTDGVKAIQIFLQAEGLFAAPTATGYYGPITQSGVKQFQTQQALPVTGVVDAATLQKMQTLAPQVAPSTGATLQQISVPASH